MKPPRELPPDEQITAHAENRSEWRADLHADRRRLVVHHDGREAGVKDHDGKNFPVRQRSTLWVYVDEKPGR